MTNTTYSITIKVNNESKETEIFFAQWESFEFGKKAVATKKHQANESFALIKLIDMYKKDFPSIEVEYEFVKSSGVSTSGGKF